MIKLFGIIHPAKFILLNVLLRGLIYLRLERCVIIFSCFNWKFLLASYSPSSLSVYVLAKFQTQKDSLSLWLCIYMFRWNFKLKKALSLSLFMYIYVLVKFQTQKHTIQCLMLSEQHPIKSIVYITLYSKNTNFKHKTVPLDSHFQTAFPIAIVT